MVRPARAPKPIPATPLHLANLMVAFTPINVIEAYYRARVRAAAEASETAAKRNVSAGVTEPDEKGEGSDESEQEDVIDKVVKLYDVY